MTITEGPEPLTPEDIWIALEVHNGMTKTVYKIKRHGWLKFKNKSPNKTLTITSGDNPPPFLVEGNPPAQSGFVVPAGSQVKAQVAPSYDVGDRFAYQAQIEGSAPEDPIVIVDQ